MSRVLKSKSYYKELFGGLLVFVFFLFLSWCVLFVYQYYYGFEFGSFMMASLAMATIGLGLGYLLVSHFVESKHYMQNHILYVVDEVIHELNLPLSTIKANASMLEKSVIDSKSKVRLNRINEATIRFERLHKMLVYEITKEVIVINKEKFALEEVLQDIISQFLEQNRNKIEFNFEPTIVYTDKIGCMQMIENVIGNAIKYSHKDSSIRIYLASNKLEVIDEGIGMDETELLHMHERYYQGDISAEGMGIGLALVKRFCDNEEIGFLVNSKKNQGTQVVINFTSCVV